MGGVKGGRRDREGQARKGSLLPPGAVPTCSHRVEDRLSNTGRKQNVGGMEQRGCRGSSTSWHYSTQASNYM